MMEDITIMDRLTRMIEAATDYIAARAAIEQLKMAAYTKIHSQQRDQEEWAPRFEIPISERWEAQQ